MSATPERSSLPHDVAAEVRAHLARQRLSGRQAAMRLGWTQPYMSRRLTGEIPFDVADLEAIANLLGIPATAFFQRPRYTGPAFAPGQGVRLTERRPRFTLAA